MKHSARRLKPRKLDASRIKLTAADRERVDSHLEASLKLTPEQRLRKLGKLMRFVWKHMTPEGRKFFLAERALYEENFARVNAHRPSRRKRETA